VTSLSPRGLNALKFTEQNETVNLSSRAHNGQRSAHAFPDVQNATCNTVTRIFAVAGFLPRRFREAAPKLLMKTAAVVAGNFCW